MMLQSLASSGVRTVALRLDPIDVLFFRDGRPFTEATRGQSGLPRPQTFAGALRTHLLREAGCSLDGFGQLAEHLWAGQSLEEAIAQVCGAGWIARVEVRGPWLCQEGNGTCEVLVPIPANIQKLKGSSGQHSAMVQDAVAPEGSTGSAGNPDRQWVRFDPLTPKLEFPGWQPPAPGMRPLWPRGRVRSERMSGYLRPAGLRAFLAGQCPSEDTIVSSEELYGFDQRTGIVVQPDRLTVEEHLIYTVSLLALRPGVGFYVEVVLPDDAPPGVFDQEVVLDFGGEGRKVRAYSTERFAWPDPPSPSEGRVLLLLTTPAVFAARWQPRLPESVRLVAAAVNGYEAFSGWDLAQGGPKPTRFAVPAGSVYFLEYPNEPFPSDSLAESEEDRRLGFGCVVQGVWNYV